MVEDSWTWTVKRQIPSQWGAGKQFVEEILDQLRKNRWIGKDVYGVHLALEEALVNAITHGNGLDAEKLVSVTCKMSPDRFWVEIADEGKGFNPDDVPDPTIPANLECPCGRGILLMRNFMSRVEYNKLGNCVVMEKSRCDSA